MTNAELRDLIERLRSVGTDHAGVEAKRAEKELPRRIWETLSAFANTPGGGVIVLELDEGSGFSVIGAGNAGKIQADLASLCDLMVPPLRPLIQIHRFEGQTLITAEIPEIDRASKPCYYQGAGLTNGAFIRVADGDRRLNQYEIQLLLASRGQPCEDEHAVSQSSIEDFDQDLVRGLVHRVRSASPRLAALDDLALLRSLKVIVDDANGIACPTLGGLLALGRFPQSLFPALAVHFLAHPESRPSAGQDRFLDNRRLDGPIPLLLTQTLAALRQHMARRTTIRGDRREDHYQYPETAMREAVVNALAHRDLGPLARSTPVQVNLFPDRLVITNPGGLFGPVTLDRLGEPGILAARNASLMRILEDLPGPNGLGPVCENRGSGITAMLESLRRAGLRPPIFEDRIASFTVTFLAESLLDSDTLRWLDDLGIEGLSGSQRAVLAMLHRGDDVTHASFQSVTGLQSQSAKRELDDLVRRGLLEELGEGSLASYRLAVHDRRDRRAEILRLLRLKGPLSRAEIETALGLEPANAAWWIRSLKSERLIEPTHPGRSPKVKYRLRRARRR